MRPVRSVCLYFFVIFIGGALLAPWLYKTLQSLASGIPVLNSVAAHPFPRYLNRTLMVLGLVGLWPLTQNLGFRSWQDVGLKISDTSRKEIARGFLIGFGSLAGVALIALLCGARSLNANHSAGDLARHLANAGSAAILVSFLEELFFRGVLFGGLKKALAWPSALILSSAIYAALHFVQRVTHSGPVDWSAGLMVLWSMLQGIGDAEQFVPGLLNLTLAGIILGLGYQWTGALYFSVGLHAGWIFWLKSYGFVTEEVAIDSRWFWGTGKLIDGCLALMALLIVLTLLFRAKSPTNQDATFERMNHIP